jgi:ParB family chromosome partitioning protein
MRAETNAAKAAGKPQGAGPGDPSSPLRDRGVTNAPGDGPLHLPLDVIDEDPNQPRKPDNPGFSFESLAELAATIRERGVKSPISVRENHKSAGRYLINHGARRYRASKLIGKETIPAFVDNDYNEADQVIENLQRNELTPREIADFIGRELAKGKKRRDIAKEIGKSPAFVTQYVTLLDLPEPIAAAFNSGRAKDVTVVNELVTAYKKNSNEVAAWLADDSEELTRGSVKLLRAYLDDRRRQVDDDSNLDDVDALTGKADAEDEGGEQGPHDGDAKKEVGRGKLNKAVILVKHGQRMARLLTTRRPSADGWAWLKYQDDGHEFEADLGTVQLIAVVEG